MASDKKPKAADINAELKSWDVTDPLKAAVFADRLEEADWFHGVENRYGTNPTLALLRAGVPVHVARHPKSGKVVAWPVEMSKRSSRWPRASGRHEWVHGPHSSVEIAHPLHEGGSFHLYPGRETRPTREAALRIARSAAFHDIRNVDEHLVIGKGGPVRILHRKGETGATTTELDPHDYFTAAIGRSHKTLDDALTHAARLAHPVAEEGEHGVYQRTDGKYTLVRHRPPLHGNQTVSDNHETPEAALASIPHRMSRQRTVPLDDDQAALVAAHGRKKRPTAPLLALADWMMEKHSDAPAGKWAAHVLTHPKAKVVYKGKSGYLGKGNTVSVQPVAHDEGYVPASHGIGRGVWHRLDIQHPLHSMTVYAPIGSRQELGEMVDDLVHPDRKAAANTLADEWAAMYGLPDAPPVKLSRNPHDWTHLGPYNDWVQENGGYHDDESQNAVNAHLWDGAPKPHIAVHPDSGKPVAWVDAHPSLIDSPAAHEARIGTATAGLDFYHGPGGVYSTRRRAATGRYSVLRHGDDAWGIAPHGVGGREVGAAAFSSHEEAARQLIATRAVAKRIASRLAFPKNLPHRMARVQAPAGGAVVNNTYSEGGKFLAEPLKRIRDVTAKLKRLRVSS